MRGSVHWPRRLCSRRLAGGRKVGRGLPRWIKVCGSHLFTSGRRSGWWLGLGWLWWWIWPLTLRHTKAAELIDLPIWSVAFIGPILNEVLRGHPRAYVDGARARVRVASRACSVRFWMSSRVRKPPSAHTVPRIHLQSAPKAWYRPGCTNMPVMYVKCLPQRVHTEISRKKRLRCGFRERPFLHGRNDPARTRWPSSPSSLSSLHSSYHRGPFSSAKLAGQTSRTVPG